MKMVNVLLRDVPGELKAQAVRVPNDATEEEMEAAVETKARQVRRRVGWPEEMMVPTPREKRYAVLREYADGRLHYRRYASLSGARGSLKSRRARARHLAGPRLCQAIVIIEKCKAGAHPVERHECSPARGLVCRIVPYAEW